MVPSLCYYQTMHISKVEYLLSDQEVDQQLDSYLNSKVEYQEENENQIIQKDINESVQFIPCPKGSGNKNLAPIILSNV